MKTSLPRLAIALIFASAIISLTCMEAKAQSNVYEYLFHGGTYNSDAERQALYTSNAELPLGGLFAPGFTRTLTLLGGVNYPSAGVSENGFQPAVTPLPVITGLTLSSVSFPGERSLDDSGYALSFAFGRRHSRKLRSEIEVAFRSNEINRTSVEPTFTIASGVVVQGNPLITEEEDGSVNATSIMKNFIFEFENDTLFTPYVGIGIGLSYIDVEFSEANSPDGEATFQDGEAAFSYQAIGGVATKLNSFAELVVEYRFLGTSELEFSGLNDTFAYNTSNLFLGAKFEY